MFEVSERVFECQESAMSAYRMPTFRVPKNQEISQNAEIGEMPGASAREWSRVKEDAK